MGVMRRSKNKWYIDYRANGKRYRECVGPNKTLAKQVLSKRILEIAEGKFLDKKKVSSTTFEELSHDYIELYSKNNKRSWEKDLTRLKPLKRFFGGKYLHKITPLMVEQYKSSRIKEVSPATVNRELACIKNMFTKALEWGKCDTNPAKPIKLFKEDNHRLRYLDKNEMTRLLSNSEGYLKAILIIALNTGMRKGEILNLKWHDVDFARKFIYLLRTKNGDRRELPMNSIVESTLKNYPKHSSSDYIFCKSDGTPLGRIDRSFHTALRKSNITSFRFHDLRHTFASHLAMNGVDLNTIRELMGHKKFEMTLRYAHLSSAHKRRAVDVLIEKWSTIGSQEEMVNIPKEYNVSNALEYKGMKKFSVTVT